MTEQFDNEMEREALRNSVIVTLWSLSRNSVASSSNSPIAALDQPKRIYFLICSLLSEVSKLWDDTWPQKYIHQQIAFLESWQKT